MQRPPSGIFSRERISVWHKRERIDDGTVVALVTTGAPASDPGWSAVTSRRTQPRRAPGDVVRWERWG